MRREIEFVPATDIWGVEIKFLLYGQKAVIQFVLRTNWHSNELPSGLERDGWLSPNRPHAVDLGYHAYAPQHEYHEPITDNCEYLNGAPCYYDGSSLMAIDTLELLIIEGGEAVWKKMEQCYIEWFGADEEAENGDS